MLLKKLSWESWAVIAVTLNLLFFQTGNYWSATWLSKWAFLMVLLAVTISFWTAKRTHWLHLPLLLYSLVGLVVLAAWPQSPYRQLLDATTLLALQKNAAIGFLQLCAGIGIFYSVNNKKSSLGVVIAMSALWAIGVTGILLQPSQGLNSPPNNGLWFGNPSMGASLLACLMPFAWAVPGALNLKAPRALVFVYPPAVSVLTLLMIYRTQASVPWGVFGVVTAAVIAARSLRKPSSLIWILPTLSLIAAFLIGLGKATLGASFWDENQRFRIWHMGWDWFWAHAYPSVGLGYSTTQILLPIEQVMTKNYFGDYFLWFHNDWLQLGIEGGYIGMFCVFLSLGRLLWAAWPRPALFGALMGFVTLGLFNYPLRMPIHCFCLALICGTIEAHATRSEKKQLQTSKKASKRSRLEPLSEAVH